MALTPRPSGVPDTPTASGKRWDASRVDCGFTPLSNGVPVIGFHVNLVEPKGGVPGAWSVFRIYPETPDRVFAGMEDKMVFLKFATETAAEAVLGAFLS